MAINKNELLKALKADKKEAERLQKDFDHKFHEAFVYVWYRNTTEEYYIGVHCGNPNDGYIGSGHIFKDKYKACPEEWVRKFVFPCGTYEEALTLESELVDEDLLRDVKCLNLKTGGNNGRVNNATKLKISLSMKNKPKTEAHKNSMKKPKTREHALKVGKTHMKKVRCIETGIVYDCIKDAAESVGLIPKSCNIGSVCKGNRPSAGGYSWEYVK